MNQTASATTGIAGIDHRPVRSAEDNVYQKITWRVMPIVLIAYIFAFLDRINIGYAQLQMKQDLAFSDAIYGLGAGIFFITYRWITAVPYIFGSIGVLVISRSSDRFKERRWHVGGTLVVGAAALFATSFLGTAFTPVMVLLCIAAFFIFGGGSLFWSIPPTYLSREAAASGIAVISSLGILGGFVSPTLIGWIKGATGSIQMGLGALTALVIVGGLTILIGLPKSAVRVGAAADTTAH